MVIHGNQLDRIPDSYRRYLANRLRRAFGLSGTDVRILLKAADNPFASRRRKH